jgi:hypothetical protein
MWGRYASRRGEARYPSLWDGRVAAWCPSVTGPTGVRLYDLQSQRYQGTLTNMDAPTDWVRSTGQYALDFDGVNDRVTLPSAVKVTTGVAFSVSLWGNTTNLTTVQYPHAITLQSTVGTTPFEIAISAQTAYLGVIWGSSANWGNFRNGIAWASNVWNHVAIVYNGGTATVSSSWKSYVNGVEISVAASGPFAALTNSSVIGGVAGGGSSNHWLGLIDDVAAYNRTLTAGEIRTLSRRRGIAYEARRQDYGSSGFQAAWARQRAQLIGGGLR